MKSDKDIQNTYKEPHKALIELFTNKKTYKEDYTLKARIGMFILRMLCVLEIEWTD